MPRSARARSESPPRSTSATIFVCRSPRRAAPSASWSKAGALIAAKVEGWDKPAFLAKEAESPPRVGPSALVSPFDPLVWHRARTERLFGFHYRIELYTPAAKRRFGYYVLPFLHNGRLAARLDLKSDRAGGALLVNAAFAEEGADREPLAGAIADELRRLAGWLGLGEIRVGKRGDLAQAIARRI